MTIKELADYTRMSPLQRRHWNTQIKDPFTGRRKGVPGLRSVRLAVRSETTAATAIFWRLSDMTPELKSRLQETLENLENPPTPEEQAEQDKVQAIRDHFTQRLAR
jgi:hypothetical protein